MIDDPVIDLQSSLSTQIRLQKWIHLEYTNEYILYCDTIALILNFTVSRENYAIKTECRLCNNSFSEYWLPGVSLTHFDFC